MTTAAPLPTEEPPARTVTLGGTTYPVLLPRLRDPRLHLASVIMTIHLLGQVALDFKVSLVHIVAAIGTAFVLELSVTFFRKRAFVWPASAMLTGSGVALILRLPDAQANQPWDVQGWHYYALISALSLLTKYCIRYGGAHVFNPSNIVLVGAFVLLGSDRVEPLDFWWAPIGPAMLLAYAAIVGGGIAIVFRLRLLGLAAGFWITLVVALGVLAVFDHCISALWSLTPVCDTHFWWVVVTSPETLVFLFFMITDPRTVPSGPRSRVIFGCAVAVVSAFLMAPQSTEFGAKVGLLGGLAVCSLLRLGVKVFADRRPQTMRALGSLAGGTSSWGAGALLTVALVAALVWAGGPAREVDRVDAAEVPDVSALYPMVAVGDVPVVTFTDEANDFADAIGTTPVEAARRLLWMLDVEADGFRLGDPGIVEAVTYGPRRVAALERLESGAGPVNYALDSMHMVLVRRGQGGVRLGFEVVGATFSDAAVDGAGADEAEVRRPLAALYVMLGFAGDRWVLVDEIEPGTG